MAMEMRDMPPKNGSISAVYRSKTTVTSSMLSKLGVSVAT